MTELAAKLYVPLAPRAASIAGAAEHQSVHFIESTWREWLECADIDPAVSDHVFASIGAGQVSRAQLRRMAAQSDSPDGRLALLIAVLVWGRGKSNGRMREPIRRLLTDPRRDEVLEQTAALAREGAAADAFKAWNLPGLQAAFFTKWLWAASSNNEQRRCLVQDSLVWASLKAFGWYSVEAAGGTRDRGKRYAAYVEDVHECARHLSADGNEVSAEDVEYKLFDMKGDLSRL